MPEQLTKIQQKALDTIVEFNRDQGFAPTVRDLSSILDRSPSTVHKILLALEEKGHITRKEGLSRGILIKRDSHNTATIPILGRIAAGEPILAEEHYDGYIELDSSIVGRGEYFALRVSGDSMIGANILDGDTAVILSSNEAEKGEIVAALLNGEATLKRLMRKGRRTFLMPENPAYSPIELDEARGPAQILGILKAVIRRY